MAAVCNGMAAYGGGLVPFCATFLNFIGYVSLTNCGMRYRPEFHWLF